MIFRETPLAGAWVLNFSVSAIRTGGLPAPCPVRLTAKKNYNRVRFCGNESK